MAQEKVKSISIHSSTATLMRFETLIPQSMPFFEIHDDKSLLKYIRKVEGIVRSSYEYRKYISFLKNEMDMTRCSFFDKIDLKDVKKVQIEFHHHPFTLFDIVSIVIEKYINMGHDIECFVDPLIIADEVCEIHYKNMAGLIPLSTTVHELAHSGEIFIPVNLVFGNVKKFVNEYKNYIKDEILEKIDVFKNISRMYEKLPILEKNLRYISIDDRKELEKIYKVEKKKIAA